MAWRSIVGVIAGFVLWWVLFSTVIARNRISALIVAALLLLYAGVEHYILLWDKLPAWYNLIVPLVIAGSVWLGGRIYRVAAREERNP